MVPFTSAATSTSLSFDGRDLPRRSIGARDSISSGVGSQLRRVVRLHCPNCGHPVDAEQINIQRMVALCERCSSVFDINRQQPKTKRRKTKRPQQLQILMEDPLHLAFRTNFRLDKNENFTASAIFSGVFSLVTLLMAGLYLENEVPIILPLVFVTMACVALYSLATIVYNKTHIRLDAASVQVSRRPLPSLTRERQLELDDVDAFYAEETAASRREGYDTPRYNVWVSYAEGGRKLVSGDIIEDYANYVASALNRNLAREEHSSAARLSENPLEDQSALGATEKPASEREGLR